MPRPVEHARRMPRSGIRAVMDAAWARGGDVIGLHVGEPSFPTPGHVLDGARRALDRGETHYVPNAGLPELRTAIADKVKARNGIAASPEQVVVTAGGMEALLNAVSMVVAAGDEVLIPDPGWPNFEMVVTLDQGKPVRYPLRAENHFLPDVADLQPLVTDRTVAMIVNSPSNPLGAVLTPQLSAALTDFAAAHDLWMISDECYDELVFDQPHVSPAAQAGADRVISCFSFSKTYAMTGLRVGYAIVPEELAPVSAKLQETMIACVNAPAQWAALAALDGPQDAVATMRDAYRERRDAATALLDDLGIGYLRPQGAFYLWTDVREQSGGDVQRWALDLLEDKGVAVAPGTAFGPAGEGWVRLSLATDTEQLLEGCRRIASFG